MMKLKKYQSKKTFQDQKNTIIKKLDLTGKKQKNDEIAKNKNKTIAKTI